MEAYVHDAVLDMHMAREQLESALDAIHGDDWNRYVPYGSLTLKELLAHVAAADQAWAVLAQGLLKSEGDDKPPVPPEAARTVRERAIERGRDMPVTALRDEMTRRRKLLLSLYELLEPRHLATALPAFGAHDSVRERIWRGYHDRLHTADVKRAMRLRWHPQGLTFLPELAPVVEALSPDPALYIIHSVDPVAWELPSPVPEWTHRMLLAHIATGDWVLQGHLRHIIDTATVAPWPDVDAGNAQRLKERAFSPDATLTEEYLSMRHETLRLLADLRPEHLQLPIELWWEPVPADRTVLDYLVGFERHDLHHREQLRGAMRYARALRGA